MLDPKRRLAALSTLIHKHRDIVDHRVTEPEIPAWCASRGWSDFLLSLPDSALACSEANGFARVVAQQPDPPASLVESIRQVGELTVIPPLQADAPLPHTEQHRVKARKRKQLSALLSAASGLAQDAERIVDVGAGQGHLTRAAARAWNKGAVGLDRQVELVGAARVLAADHRVVFQLWDAFEQDLELEPTDLVTGLHACGELGDILVRRAAKAGARVLLVSCCPQKVRSERRAALSNLGKEGNLELSRGVLGLANLSQLEQGVEASLVDTMRSRQTRHAMRLLFQHRGISVAAGEEMRGLNRRRAYRGLGHLAEHALSRRGLVPATCDEIASFERLAAQQYGTMRRLSLPRTMLARAIEVAVVLDRAVYLIEQGYDVQVATVFEPGVSPRNLGIFAYR